MNPTRFARFKGPIAGGTLAFVLLLGAVAFVPAGCSAGAAAPCDSTQCAAKNTCVTIAGGGGSAACGRPCAIHTDCPFNYHCDANTGGSSPYCVINTTTFPDKPGTQFNAPCSAAAGFQNNPACDTADGFWCNAKSPLDGAAYCTLFGCKADTDCGEGFYCGKENQFPNAASNQLQNGKTDDVCLPRGYCAPCTTDVDCGPLNGTPQHCLAGADQAKFCAPECKTNSQCALDATCTTYTSFDACIPRAGVCKGDGTLCAPCRSDADCTAGSCVPAFNSTEHFCTSKSGTPCSYSSTFQIIDQCPSSTKATPVVGCSTSNVQPNMPPNLCLGEVQQGVDDQGNPSYVEGCWTVH